MALFVLRSSLKHRLSLESKSTAATYSIIYDFVKGTLLISRFMEKKFYHIPNYIEQPDWGARRVDFSTCSLSSLAFKKKLGKKISNNISSCCHWLNKKVFVWIYMYILLVKLVYSFIPNFLHFFIIVKGVIFDTCTSTTLEV